LGDDLIETASEKSAERPPSTTVNAFSVFNSLNETQNLPSSRAPEELEPQTSTEQHYFDDSTGKTETTSEENVMSESEPAQVEN